MPDNIEGIKDGVEVPLSDNIEITELHCHNCDGYIKFALDKSKNGQHVVICPKCGHEHCRVIKDGIVTGDRWDSRNPNSPPSQNTWTVTVTMDNYSTASWQSINSGGSNDSYLQDSWGQGSDTSTMYKYYTTYVMGQYP